MSAIAGISSDLFRGLQIAPRSTPPKTTQPPAPAQSTTLSFNHGFALKIESAVTTALQNAPAGSDPNKIIKDAIINALQSTKTTSSNSQSLAASSVPPLSPADFASDTSFNRLLESYGISSKQFQQDLQSALKTPAPTAKTPINYITLFKNLPSGSLFDAYS